MPRDDSIRCSPPNHVRGPEDRGAGHLVTLRRSKSGGSPIPLAAAACSAESQRRRRSTEIGSRNRRLLGDENVHWYELRAREGASGPICATRLRTKSVSWEQSPRQPKVSWRPGDERGARCLPSATGDRSLAHIASTPPPSRTPADPRASNRRTSIVPRTMSARGPRAWGAR